jgi:hypothetical protein
MPYLIALLLFFICSLSGDSSNYSEIRNRTPSYVSQSGFQRPCQLDWQCTDGLSCRAGWCRPQDFRGEAGESCSDPNGGDCRSRICSGSRCQATAAVPANNGDFCNESGSCRSRQCLENRCVPSYSFPAFPNQLCSVNSDCLSGRCDSNTCRYSSGSLTCAPLGVAHGGNASICCSGYGSTVCEPRTSSECTQEGFCTGQVGRVCAGPGNHVQFENQCCSGKWSVGVCIPRSEKSFSPCENNSGCRSDSYCDLKLNLCKKKY